VTPLGRLLARRIRQAGPLTLAQYMAEALGHPEHGYYRTRDPFGAAGDFTTAPEISQMFGELLGLWCLEMWQALGTPDAVSLVELGPGRGTLLADALRAARLRPAFRAAVTVHLVETSESLRARQATTLAQAEPGVAPVWHESLATVPDGPMLLLANELFDALPIHQFVRAEEGWRERVVALADDGESLCFGLAPPGPALALLGEAQRVAPIGAIAEVSPAAIALAAEIARRAVAGGAALVIDYGPAASGPGDEVSAGRVRPATRIAILPIWRPCAIVLNASTTASRSNVLTWRGHNSPVPMRAITSRSRSPSAAGRSRAMRSRSTAKYDRFRWNGCRPT